MKKTMITIDEYMSMSEEELNEFIDRHEHLIAEGVIDENQPMVDFMGMSTEEMVQKYNLTPINVVYERIMERLNKWR